ncbi:hypothetical protein GCM10009555_065370 [Acrocarpospora macrocephala]|uniref:Bacterial Ig-like domain-containing protein n=1 Tax=Acrocarpospora macrocephala TaxID=150177 RepID=A0A5M3X199_9ACTN|nr:hypothetical protein [Acrocarpospora macrocephala]GES14934.1 hypothetical protein Amac_085310 [Acrocarpospora macrocephala]
MRFAKTLITGVLSASLIAVPFAGASLADTATYRPPVASAVQQKDRQPQVSVSDDQVASGGSYTVTVETKGVRYVGIATITGLNGRTYTVRLRDGRATKTLTVPEGIRPGTYQIHATVDGRSASASINVTRGSRHDGRH